MAEACPSGAVTCYTYYTSPVGSLLLAGDAQGLSLIAFESGGRPAPAGAGWRDDPAALRPALEQIGAYFAGELTEFDLTLAPAGTGFQRQVWGALREIPYGQTLSYGELARRIGRPGASRAVGAANGANPLPVVIPCHRVIGSDGGLTGFGGGLDVKLWLLDHERGQGRLF